MTGTLAKNKFYGVYYKDYDKNKILTYLKEGKGNLCDYRRLHHPEYAPNSIYAWMECQDTEFRIECRKHRNKNKKASAVNKFVEDQIRDNLIHNQKMWRQNLAEVVDLIPGGKDNGFI